MNVRSNDEEEEDYSPLAHQVAGCHSGTPSNILIDKKGLVLKPYKPVSNPTFQPEKDGKYFNTIRDLVPVSLNELQFYAMLESSRHQDFLSLKEMTPKYFGSRIVHGQDHLLLEDFTHKMKYPCVMDLKIGKDRYYPGRSAEKAKQDTVKYPCLKELGFCIAGIKLSNAFTGRVDMHYMPKTTRKFSSSDVAEHVRKFLHFDERHIGDTFKELLQGAEAILNWASSQTSIFLRGSSLLFVYDAEGLKHRGRKDILKARVGMIDFAHVFYSFGEEDRNYTSGLKNLMKVLKTGKSPE